MEDALKVAIVITSIFDPTEGVRAFASKSAYKVFVVGDLKTPTGWDCPDVEYVSIQQQKISEFSLSEVLPYNHYCRKMIGYLYAIKRGYNIIVDTDDDNIPKPDWGFPSFVGKYESVQEGYGNVNVYHAFTEQMIWPRGFPLNLIKKKFDFQKISETKFCKVGIWQGLADEDPDVDAIYRLTNDQPCYFFDRDPLVLGKETVCPFNSQNTVFLKDLFHLLYLPCHVTFRFTDILRGLVAQPILWAYDFQLGFLKATVVQKRNVHDYMRDFESELPMYQYCDQIVDVVSSVIVSNDIIENNLHRAYSALVAKGMVPKAEMTTLEAWLKDISD